MPPGLLVTSTRDLLPSDTALSDRALPCACGNSQLVAFEALPHVFCYHFQLPETQEALQIMSNLFRQNVGPR